MKRVFSDVIQFRGSHYDFGYRQGELLKDSPILPNRKKFWGSKSKLRHYLVNDMEVKRMILHFAPGIWDELTGLSDALKMNLTDTLIQFGGYYLEYGKSGCSIFTNGDYMIRNYDNDPLSYEGRYVLYQPSDQGYAMIGPSMQITGRTDGINEKGLSMGYNLINRVRSDDGFICNMIGRIILEMCANVEEAVSLLKEIPHRRSFSYVLLDPNGESVVVEASPREVVVHHANICTNHFEILTHENRYKFEDSRNRYEAMEKQKSTIIAPFSAYQMLNDSDKEVFSKKYGAWAGTLHTAAYFPKELKAWFALGGDRLPFIFDFHQWLHGEKLHVTRLKGELDTTIPFVNMEEATNGKR
ncbi:C45 family peptidase [Neobacillus mesonae]|uniref:C45 family autoproteolytic acyltransferase/hydolase n=1 Tax=Neobacillus mesonae TaxID=1193713 RepID=UPI0020402663|nr:C45 family peptidase [Neobacillus mesonae]MCM3569281.1 C45 family autoproteolytic acyltransferase/hydrolase [Neobacillus mesonae]